MLKQTLACAILAASSHAALAANNMDLKVSGNLAPVACNITLGNGGVIDYGNISPDILKANERTLLAEKQIAIQIDCDAPIKVAVGAITRRPGTGADGAKNPNGTTYLSGQRPLTQTYVHGLGKHENKDIGGYALTLHAGYLSADGKKVVGITSTPSGWENAVYGKLVNGYSGFYQTWAEPGKLDPIPFKTFNTLLRVQAYIDKKSKLDFAKPIKLDGASTLELKYL